jgi:hypothetical protein
MQARIDTGWKFWRAICDAEAAEKGVLILGSQQSYNTSRQPRRHSAVSYSLKKFSECFCPETDRPFGHCKLTFQVAHGNLSLGKAAQHWGTAGLQLRRDAFFEGVFP